MNCCCEGDVGLQFGEMGQYAGESGIGLEVDCVEFGCTGDLGGLDPSSAVSDTL